MKLKSFVINVFYILFINFFISINFVFAEIQLSTPGSIIVITYDELGNQINKCKVVFTLPGKDGELNKGADTLFPLTDGDKDDDLSYFKEEKIADGDIELSHQTINSLELKNNQQVSINVMLDGYVSWSTTTKYLSSLINIIESKNPFNLKVIDTNYSKETYHPFLIEISRNIKTEDSKSETYSLEDGGKFDGDNEANGIIYFSVPIANNESKKFNIHIKDKNGKLLKKFENFIIDGIRQSLIKF